MNLLITNSVPLNGGDEALLRATVEAVQRRWPRSRVAVLCKDVELCRHQLPDLELASDLEFADEPAARDRALSFYRGADLILSAPGGFLHDYYSIEERLQGFETALGLSKPVILFGQSTGPFWKPESLRRVPEVFNRLSRICVRDHASSLHLLACGVNPALIRETADAAFLWRDLAPELFGAGGMPEQQVGVCFRGWPLDDTVIVKRTIRKAAALCRHILARDGWKILFLSTCQGIAGYVDDSSLARQIVAALPAGLQTRCRIDAARYPPRDLIRALGRCHAFIGMRLHACLLALLAGVPAAGLGYEQKTEQIYRQMGLDAYQTGFETDEGCWLQCADRLLGDAACIRAQLPHILDLLCRRASANLDAIGEEMETLRG